MTPTSGASARAANAAGAVPARRPLSRLWKPPPRAGRCGSSSAGLPPGLDQRLGVCVPPGRSTATASTPSVASLTRQRFAYEPREGRCRLLPSVDRHGLRQEGGQDPAFKWANTLLGNLKTSLTGTFHAIRDKHVPRYLAQFQYRFNRRYDLAAMIPRLGWAAVRTPPMPYRLLKLAEVCW